MLFKETSGTDFQKRHKLNEHKCQLPAFLVTQKLISTRSFHYLWWKGIKENQECTNGDYSSLTINLFCKC